LDVSAPYLRSSYINVSMRHQSYTVPHSSVKTLWMHLCSSGWAFSASRLTSKTYELFLDIPSGSASLASLPPLLVSFRHRYPLCVFLPFLLPESQLLKSCVTLDVTYTLEWGKMSCQCAWLCLVVIFKAYARFSLLTDLQSRSRL
jgi:hypothetical protein